MAKRAATNDEQHFDDPFITVAEAARQLNKHRSTVGQWVKDGLLNATRMPSGMWAIRVSELNKFLGGTALPTREIA